MRRCHYCHRILWPWQSQGFRYLTAKYVLRWHGRCWRLAP